jgi:glycosyltransferase involved in cell wall biosynthesis
MENNRVAICQPYIILGGRLQVMLGIVRALNQLGIEPDILTLGLSFDPQQIQTNYGHDLKMRFRVVFKVFPWKYVLQDLQILIFNALLKRIGSGYELLIDSSNSQIFLPEKQIILSYVHFPREKRLSGGFSNGNLPHIKPTFFSLQRIFSGLINILYKWNKRTPNHKIICNSKFSRQSLLDIFPELTNENIQVIYPPVDISLYENNEQKKENAVVSLGRFSPDKKQLEQIKIAQLLPNLTFYLIGFVNHKKYFEECRDFIKTNRVVNVMLYPNASLDEVINLLKSSKYFLHLLVDEPFGVTAVQAIAAGCLPLVHDSGGQRETVPDPDLRFSSLEEIPQIISNMENKKPGDIDKIINHLQQNAKRKFDHNVFAEKITKVLKDLLNIR